MDKSGVDASADAEAEDEAEDEAEGVCCRPALGVTAGARDCTGVACGVLGAATDDEDDEDDDDDDALRAVVDRCPRGSDAATGVVIAAADDEDAATGVLTRRVTGEAANHKKCENK